MEYALGLEGRQDYPGHCPKVTRGNMTLLRGDQRMGDGVHRKCDSILYPNFAHQFRYMRLHSALLDPESGPDFLVGTARNQHFQHFLLAVGECHAASGKNSAW